MLDICLLGTGGMMPLPYRWLTSMMARCAGSNLLIDCGEGTQIALKEKGWSPKPIDVICFTHYHADHISGLPGLLLTMGNAERTEPLTLIGPKGLERVVNALCMIAPELPFDLKFIELTEQEESLQIGPYMIDAYRVNHEGDLLWILNRIPERPVRCRPCKRADDPSEILEPSPAKGEIIEEDGRTFTPDMVLGADRRGLKVTYCTDTRPVPVIAQYAKDADLFICEGMYGEKEKAAKAREYKHMTFYEAANLAKEAQPAQMWLTHYSPSLTRPEEYMEEVKQIFPRAKAARDGWTVELEFDEE